MSRTLVTGATGFIGCRLCEFLREAGRPVRAVGLVRNEVEKERAAGLEHAGIPFASGKLALDEETLQDVDTVIHLAAAQHEANVDAGYFMRVNVEATRSLLELCESSGVERFFYASSIGVYGDNGRPGISELTPLDPDNDYGRSKAAAERMIEEYSGELQIFIGRIGETYGPWDRRLHKLYAAIRKKRFWLVGDGNNLHQPIYVDDLAAAIDGLMNSPDAVRRPVILCGDRAVTTREMCESIAEALGASLGRRRIPMAPLVLAAGAMEATLGRAGIQPPLHRRRLDFFRKSLSFSTELRRQLLDVPPQLSFAEGARRTAEWYTRKGWL